MEDKVIGPLALKQFLYIFAAIAVFATLYSVFKPKNIAIFTVTLSPVFMLAGMMAFFKPNDRPMESFILSAVYFFVNTRRRIWHRETSNITDIITKKPEKKEEGPHKQVPARSQLEVLARVVDTAGWGQEGLDDTGRIKAPEYNKTLENTLVDPQEETDKQKNGLIKYMESVTAKHKKKKPEPTVQQMATIEPEQQKFDYEQDAIQLADSDIIKMAQDYSRKKHK